MLYRKGGIGRILLRTVFRSLFAFGRMTVEREKSSGRDGESRVRLLRMLQLLQTDSDADHPLSTPECIRLLKERFGLDAYRITV